MIKDELIKYIEGLTLKDRMDMHIKSILGDMSRYASLIITESHVEEKYELVKYAKEQIGEQLIIAPPITRPKDLFDFLKTHQSSRILFEEDMLIRRVNYIEILEGAVCSSPDSGALWKVQFKNELPFKFKKGIILTTKLSKEELKAKKNLSYILRDCKMI